MPFNSSFPSQTLYLSSAALLSSLSLFYLVYRSQSDTPTTLRKAIPAPSVDESVKDPELPYPPDVFPGARDVDSPYGKLRVYEWGPEDGRKVLFVHGITVPCLSLGGVAEKLVDKKCRVMLLDLWGRGYSDTPIFLPQDSRLFATALLLAITSSSIPWKSFSLIGYSLGGGIAASFTAHFPHLVDSLVLLAPAGLIRPHHFSLASRVFYSARLLPYSLLEWLVKRRLREPASATAVTPKDATAPVDREAPRMNEFGQAVLSKNRPYVTVTKVVDWQVQCNQGFVKSFISSIRYGPITAQHEDWRKIRKHLIAQNANASELPEPKIKRTGKILIICGLTDPIIVYDELMEDAVACLGTENVRIETCDTGHELPMTKTEEVVEYISDLWELNKA